MAVFSYFSFFAFISFPRFARPRHVRLSACACSLAGHAARSCGSVRSGRMSGRSIDRPSSADRWNKRRVDRSLVRLCISRVYPPHTHTYSRTHTRTHAYIHARAHIYYTHTHTYVHTVVIRGVKISGGFCGGAGKGGNRLWFCVRQLSSM